MGKPIDKQVIVITGASSGIGRETALRLGEKGAKLVVSARREDALDDLVEQITAAGGEAVSIPADVSIYSEVEALAQQAVEHYGRIDTWVNNAGVLLVGEFLKTGLEEAHRQFDVNFWGEYHGMKAVLPILQKQGSGTIINISSVTAIRALPYMSVYSASKAAIRALSETVRTEVTEKGVSIVTVFPATIDTPLFAHARSKEGVAPRAVPPVYPPSEVASAIEKAAVNPTRDVFAGRAGLMFTLGNNLMPGVLDKVIGAVKWPATFTAQPKPPRGHDNLDAPLDNSLPTTSGGWRGTRYKMAETASRIGLGLAALFLVRRLVRR